MVESNFFHQQSKSKYTANKVRKKFDVDVSCQVSMFELIDLASRSVLRSQISFDRMRIRHRFFMYELCM